MDGTYGELEAPPSVLHNYLILEEASTETQIMALTEERQKTLREDAIRQERKQLRKGLEKLESDKDAKIHWAFALPWQNEGDHHELPVGSRVLVENERDVLTVGHGPHGTYNLAEVEYRNLHFCTPPTKSERLALRARRAPHSLRVTAIPSDTRRVDARKGNCTL